MHVAFFISDISSTGGTERISLLVSNYLISIGYQVSIITLSHKNLDLRFHKDKNINIYTLRNGKGNPVKDIFLLNSILKKLKPDVLIDVDLVLTPVSFMALLFNRRIKHIAWEHFNFTINLGIKRRDLGRLLAVKYCDKIVVLTQADKLLWQSNLSATNVEVIYNPVTIERALGPVPIRTNKVILAVGRLAEQKGFDLLLQAWHKMPEEIRTQAHLKIVGDGPEKSSLVEYITHHNLQDTVDLAGYSKNIQQEYQDAYLYVLSSRYEGFVLSLTEAMASGLPVVSFDCPFGPSELINEDATGLLVEAENIQALTDSLVKMIKDESYRNISAQSSFLRSEEFTQDAILPQWHNLLSSLDA